MFRIGELIKRVVFSRGLHGLDERPRPIDGLNDQVYRVTFVNELGFINGDPVMQPGQEGQIIPRDIVGTDGSWFARHFEPGLEVELTRHSYGVAQGGRFTLVERRRNLRDWSVDRGIVLEEAALRMYLPDALEPTIPYVQPTPVPFEAQPNLLNPPVGDFEAGRVEIRGAVGEPGRINIGRTHQAYIVLWVNDRGNGDTKHKIFYNRAEADDFVRSLARWQRVIKQTSICIPL